ncbi:unnamed protein product [Symbiodinium sp. CCMP2592]|nr:unnamed protein product [Symbiodinium sp. CCMP2592]
MPEGIDAVTDCGLPALGIACIRGYVDCARTLIQCSASPEQLDARGNGPLHWAAASYADKSANDLAEMLLEAGADPFACNGSGQLPDIPNLQDMALAQAAAQRQQVTYQSEVRRCLLASVRPSFEEITESIAELFPEAKDCTARYVDEDGDACTLCEASLSDFLAQAANGVNMANSTGKMVLRLELVSLPQAEASSAPTDIPLQGSETFPASDSPSDVVQDPEHSKDPKEMPDWNVVDVPEANKDDSMPPQTSNSQATVQGPDSMAMSAKHSQVTNMQEAFEGSQNDSVPEAMCEASNFAMPLPADSNEAVNGEKAPCSKGKGYKGKGKGKGKFGWKGHWYGPEHQQEHPSQSWWQGWRGWCEWEPEDADVHHDAGETREDPPDNADQAGSCKGKGKFKGKAGKCGKGKFAWHCPDGEQEHQRRQNGALVAVVRLAAVAPAGSHDSELNQCPMKYIPLYLEHRAEQQLARFLAEVTPESASQFLVAFLSELEALDEEKKLNVMARFFESQEERLQKILQWSSPQLPGLFLLGMLGHGKGGKWGKGWAKGKAKGKCWVGSHMARGADETVPVSTTDDQHNQPAHDPSWNYFLNVPKDPNYVPYAARKDKSLSLAELTVAAGAEPASSSDGQPVDDPLWNSFLNLPKDPNYKSYVARKMEKFASRMQKNRFEPDQA